MTKIISLVKSAPGIDATRFREYWSGRYLPLLLAMPGLNSNLLRVVQNYVQATPARQDARPAEWAGVSEFWFADRAAAEAFLASPEPADLARDHPDELERIIHLPVREVLMWDRGGRHDALKQMAFFRQKPGLTREEAQRYWNVEHVAAGTRLGLAQRLGKYVQNHTFPDYHTRDPRFDYAGAPEGWFDDIKDANSLFADPRILNELSADEDKFMDRSSATMMVVEEVVVYEAPFANEARGCSPEVNL